MTKEQIAEAVTEGLKKYLSPGMSIDTGLVELITQSVWEADKSPNLGCATTFELINELYARADVAMKIDEKWPDYRTIDS